MPIDQELNWKCSQASAYVGFGFSKAVIISAVEVYKQRNRDAAHFLNYLEAQIDFPLRNIF